MEAKYLWSFFLILQLVRVSDAQVSAGTILEVLTKTTGLKTFGSWCQETVPALYSGTGVLTVFAFNDTSYANMPSQDRAKLMSLTPEEKKIYVQTFTLMARVSVDQMTDYSTLTSVNGKQLFINKRNRVYWNPGSSTGSTATYVNGAMIVREQLQASNGIIHVLDRPLNLVSDKNVYQLLMHPDDPTMQTTTWNDLMNKLYTDSIYFLNVVTPIASNDKVTFFLPSENALRKIPASKLQALQGLELSNYFKMHYVLNRVVYTSYVEHQESYETAYTGSRVMFMRQDGSRVMVKSGGVTAMVERGNITCRNGVIHIIDTMFGFVYNSAREQIQLDAPQFNMLLDRVSPDIQALITQPSGVNLFVPTDDAFTYIQNLVNLQTNNTLIDYIVRLCMVRDGSIEVSQINGNYDVRQRRYSRFNDWKLVVYNDRNESWVNGGNVRAKITRPDVKVTTGVLQYVDAVLGVPSMDIPTLIYYDDYLIMTYNDLRMVGLHEFLKDQSYNGQFLPPRVFNNYGQGTDSMGNQNNYNLFTTSFPNQYPTQFPNQQTMYPNNIPDYIYQQRLQQQQQGGNLYSTPYPNNPYPTTRFPNQYPNQQYPNQQYPNQQYPNQQYPNQQYPNQQYPNQQYPNQNNQQPGLGGNSYYGTCGSMTRVCQFTMFVPNGTAIYQYYLTQIGQSIIYDIPRYRWVFRRLIIPNQLIFLENLPVSPQSYRYKAHTGDEIVVRKETENIVRISWGGMSARVIMWDLGATNGVVHIIDTVLSTISDLTLEVSGTQYLAANIHLIALLSAALGFLLTL